MRSHVLIELLNGSGELSSIEKLFGVHSLDSYHQRETAQEASRGKARGQPDSLLSRKNPYLYRIRHDYGTLRNQSQEHSPARISALDREIFISGSMQLDYGDQCRCDSLFCLHVASGAVALVGKSHACRAMSAKYLRINVQFRHSGQHYDRLACRFAAPAAYEQRGNVRNGLQIKRSRMLSRLITNEHRLFTSVHSESIVIPAQQERALLAASRPSHPLIPWLPPCAAIARHRCDLLYLQSSWPSGHPYPSHGRQRPYQVKGVP